MSNLPSTPHTRSGRHSSLPVARNTAGLPTLSKHYPEEPFLNDPEPSVSVPAPTASPGIIDPAMFQQQMLNIMLATRDVVSATRDSARPSELMFRRDSKGLDATIGTSHFLS